MLIAATAILSFAGAPSADADDVADFSGCESVPIFGFDPKIRKICDDPIRPDGSWARYRQFMRLNQVKSSVGGQYCQGGCPAWLPHDVVPGSIGGVETYIVTDATIPPGEPGHLDNPNRCTETALRCDPA